MLIRKPSDLRYSDVTPKELYLNRRRFLGASAAALSAGALLAPSAASAATKLTATKSRYSTTEKQTPLATVSSYNNFYEFGTGKEDPSQLAPRWKVPAEWPIHIAGAGTDKAQTLDLNAIVSGKIAPLEERIYRHRCVERWSIVVPWIGIPLSAVLKLANPNSKAKYVAFESYYDSKAMLSQGEAGIRFPYVEGLRMDEANNPLTLLVVGLYGETLPNQNGAPLRLVVPWKYGFKSIKSISKINLVENMPPTTWNIANAREYGFYSNVNPEVDHPRWSQATENRLGELTPRKTVKFNGYEEQVAGMYAFLDLRKNY